MERKGGALGEAPGQRGAPILEAVAASKVLMWERVWGYEEQNSYLSFSIPFFFFFFLVRKIGHELMSVPIFLYFVCGMLPQHGCRGAMLGLCPGSEPANPEPLKQRV